ncbi:MAG TPA: iron-containing alcohol dehydrogenase, partial [Longilinea sp.]|nr:iron-containing alcohol dehydrogenase [Longilinea sp.]
VITHETNHEKIGFGYDDTFPVLSIVDPDLMMTVPPDLTAYQGFDALFHSTEGYINKYANVMSDLLALKAIELVGKHLAMAVRDPGNKEARAGMALANTLSGMVEVVSGCTSEHSMEHALSAFHPDLAHGAGLIMVSEAYYTHFARVHACDQRLVDMAMALGKSDAKEPMDFVKALVKLQDDCGVCHLKMSEYGVRRDDMEKYVHNARTAMGQLFAADPAPLSDPDVLAIYQYSYR